MPLKTKYKISGKKMKYLVFGIVIIALLVGLVWVKLPGQSATGKMSVFLTIDYGTKKSQKILTVDNQTTAFAVLNQTHSVGYKEYSMGYFITSIGNKSQNSTHSWLYFVNQEPPEISVDNYHLSDQDNLTFAFISNNESMKFFE